jgi:TatD DNase family protein
MLIDAHCHLANLHTAIPVPPIVDQAVRCGITKFFTTALTRSEAALQYEWQDPRLILGAGIHPNFDECDLNLEDIRKLCKENLIDAVGEIGYDRKGADLDTQLNLLKAQLDIAAEFDLPVVLHLVGLPQPVIDLLIKFPLRYLVHGFAGKVTQYEQLTLLNTWFTISARILNKDKSDLLKVILEGKRYLFETDITRYYVFPGESNPLLRMNDLVAETSQLSRIPVQVLEQVQRRSFTELTGASLE